MQNCLEHYTSLFVVKNFEEALEKVNILSPGVVTLPVEDAAQYVSKITSLSVLLGHFTPPLGLDLVGGPSGLVNTMGSARFSTSMSPATFNRRFTVMEFDRSALERFEQESTKLAEEEGFTTHEASFRNRREDPSRDGKKLRSNL